MRARRGRDIRRFGPAWGRGTVVVGAFSRGEVVEGVRRRDGVGGFID